MAQQQSSSGTIAGVATILGLGLVWLTVITNLPLQEELSSAALSNETRQAARLASPQSSPPTLDLTIPISPPLSSETAMPRMGTDQARDPNVDAPVVTRMDPRTLQATRLTCEADIDQLCPDSPDGSARRRCLQQRANQLLPQCQSQLQERFVKWKEDQDRLAAACADDVKRFCRVIKPGSGQILQCLQSHSQEVSDRCFQTFPKGTFYYK
jgi:Cysteine rich repeat